MLLMHSILALFSVLLLFSVRALHSVLTMGTVTSAAASDKAFFQRLTAVWASLAFFLVNRQLELKVALSTQGIDVIAETCAAKADGFDKDGLEQLLQIGKARLRDAACPAVRPDASAEETFVGVDIAHPGDHRLIK